MMCPIMTAALEEFERQGLLEMYIKQSPKAEEEEGMITQKNDDEKPAPSNTTKCYFLGVAYASSIGGAGTIIGSGISLILKGIYESTFPEAPDLSFPKWMVYSKLLFLIAN